METPIDPVVEAVCERLQPVRAVELQEKQEFVRLFLAENAETSILMTTFEGVTHYTIHHGSPNQVLRGTADQVLTLLSAVSKEDSAVIAHFTWASMGNPHYYSVTPEQIAKSSAELAAFCMMSRALGANEANTLWELRHAVQGASKENVCKIYGFSEKDWNSLRNTLDSVDNIVNNFIEKIKFRGVNHE